MILSRMYTVFRWTERRFRLLYRRLGKFYEEENRMNDQYSGLKNQTAFLSYLRNIHISYILILENYEYTVKKKDRGTGNR